ncbi:hypothetical protein, partial [uncultured Campylobacter sp.]|uniref:hypothetical protein n=1 Tax=uncultured Campylobacter sp. TaxID=218934 RepID=UPI0032119E08
SVTYYMYAPVTPNQKLFKLRLPTSGIFISYPAKFTNLTFSRCGSRQVKFELKFTNLTSNLNIKSQGEVS